MLLFLRSFLVLTFLYHILVTTLGYGVFGGHFPNMPALLRDGLWFGVVGMYALWNFKTSVQLISRSWKLRASMIGLLIFGIILSYFLGKGVSDMLIGIKYGFLYLLVFLSAQIAASKLSDFDRHRLLKWGLWIACAAVVIGFVWQGAKLLWPDLFFQLGYGRLDDFHFGAHPPLYYLTGLGGTLRWQGIFAGPNNYGYFLVAFLPLLLQELRFTFTAEKCRHRALGWAMLAVWMGAIFATLSRTAYIGTLVVLGMMYWPWIRRHWKWGIAIIAIGIMGVVGLSVLKGSSTIAHIAAKFSSLEYIFLHPLGLGLGSSGPAIHHNGNILPENFFIQICIDLGIVGFGIWLLVTRILLKRHHIGENVPFFVGFVALLAMGMFLHVFEDSMVNYSFFVLWGVMSLGEMKKSQSN